MPYYKSGEQTTKYRVIVQELHFWTEHPDREELEKPLASGQSEKPQPRNKQAWIETDNLETTSKEVLAGILRAKAGELDPPKAVTRSYDA